MELAYIDNFTYLLMLFSFTFVLIIGMIYYFSKAFSWFLNTVFRLKHTEHNHTFYDNFFEE